MNKILKLISYIVLITFLFAQIGFADTIYFYHTDPAGTPIAMTDASGSVVWKADYKPFGEEWSITSNIENNKRFVGKEKDTETGLNYFGARYMSSNIGRFISTDPVGPVDPMTGEINQIILHDPQRLNLYSYGLNNPYRYVDDDGNWAQILVPVVITAGLILLTNAHPANAPRVGDTTISPPSLKEEVATEVGGGLLGYGVGKVFGKIAGSLLGSIKNSGAWTKLSGMLRNAAKGKGNFSIGSATREEAEIMGKAWVGEGAIVSDSGNALVSADGLRTFRIAYKKGLGKMQANFEQKVEGQLTKRPISNAHLDVE